MRGRTGTVVTVIGILLVSALVSLALIRGGTTSEPSAAPTATTAAATEPQIVRANSHVLGDPADGRVTLVEFLDFECEACAAAFPFVEGLREIYAGKVRFVIRYFPLPGHANAVNAALAVEAAAQQGRLEDMYTILYRSQAEWGEKQESQAELFRGIAEELGFDMEAYDAAIADPATAARVELDRGDAEGLGLQGTPSFFLNGEPLELTSAEDVTAAIDAALAAP
jgi:protein-disulfide isomerase